MYTDSNLVPRKGGIEVEEERQLEEMQLIVTGLILVTGGGMRGQIGEVVALGEGEWILFKPQGQKHNLVFPVLYGAFEPFVLSPANLSH